jgi:hypothetical protein
VLVFQDEGPPLVFRFYDTFKEARNGRGKYIAELENQMYAALERTLKRTYANP